jgi:flagellar basal-body rod modification protein FlgD
MAVTFPPPQSPLGPAAATSSLASHPLIANNFASFLQLLTTQLQNQNPLDPLDTNQFTEQIVQFAQVEQQININASLATLISLQQSVQVNAALAFLGQTVTVGGATARLANGQAAWSFTPSKTATATITIKDAAGQTAYSGTFAVAPGQQSFVWDGKGHNGVRWPDGNYTMTISAKDSTGQDVMVSTEVTGIVDAVDVSQSPPVLWIGDQSFTIDQIGKVVQMSTSSNPNP